jgi:DNA repair protein RadA/Sms
MGRCPECGEWGSLAEAIDVPSRGIGAPVIPLAAARPLAAVDVAGTERRATGVGELDRVLGGGLVPGSVTLVGGEPGIGKSTLLLQALAGLADRGARCLLVSAEESPEQVRMRAERVGALVEGVYLAAETSLPTVLAHVEAQQPQVLVVDSVQTLEHPDVAGVPGSVAQVRDCATALVRLAKDRSLTVLLVGHVTKDGALAGPRVLEHMVDTVLAFEGDRHHALRLLRALKHRFGSTDELGIFEMTGSGLADVPDASRLFLADRRPGASGSAVAPVLESGRPLLVEVQALVDGSGVPLPRRSCQALDASRLGMLLAVLGRHASVDCSKQDVYASVAGAVKVGEPAVDLAVALAVVSAHTDVALPEDAVVLGEVGLGGEVRQVTQVERRLVEAARLGFGTAIAPASTPAVAGIEIVRCGTVRDALAAAGS